VNVIKLEFDAPTTKSKKCDDKCVRLGTILASGGRTEGRKWKNTNALCMLVSYGMLDFLSDWTD